MSRIRVTKMFPFEMAHALQNYDGACRNIHGHSYVLYVTLIGTPVNNKLDPKNGMVVDFGDIKGIVKKLIINEFDHALVICWSPENENLKQMDQMFGKLKMVDFQPTVENLLIYFANLLKNHLTPSVELHSLKLQETGTAYAEWFAGDNN
jgi:6-pyruvoyltetrahydropterin/6-carboxytetrahydropterin synthase